MAENERSFLGLTHNPFVEPYRGFFDRSGRKTYLDQLRHLSQWSRRVLLVTGPQGVGKTTLYRELAATLEPRVKAARISAGLVNTGREVLAAIAQGFGMAASSTANSQALRLDLIDHVASQASGDRPCLVLVDDAQLLDNRAVDELIALIQESALHLVLFGEVRMVPVIERAASARGVGWQEIRLSSYGEGDARDYLEWRFQQAKYRGRVPFTDQQVKELVKLSGGLPGRINQMANVLLVKLETGEVSARRGGFPRLHLAMLGLLVIVMGLLYVLFTDRPAHVDTVALRLPSPSGASAPAGASAAAAAEDDIAEGMADVAGGGSEGEPAFLPAPAPAEGAEVIEPDAAGTGAAATAAAKSAEAERTAAEPARAPAVREASDEDGEPADPGPQESAAPTRPQATVATDTAQTLRETTPAAATADAPVTAKPPAASARGSETSGVRDSRWLLRQNPNDFTLQLLTLSALDRAQAFVAKQKVPDDFAIYQLQREGRILHVVIYGLYSTRDAAERAADHLPAEVGDVRPWIRQMGQVQDAARISTLQ